MCRATQLWNLTQREAFNSDSAMAASYKLVNTEESFVLASVFEFMKTWASGQKSSLVLECDNGQAWLQLGFRLGHPSASHVSSPCYRSYQPTKRRNRKSPSKVKRDRDRAILFNASKMKIKEQNITMQENTENVGSTDDANSSTDSEDLQSDPVSVATSPKKSELSISKSTVIDISPVLPPPPNLSIVVQPSLSIPPRPVYHPAIINACRGMFGKTPSQLNNEEINEFRYYQEFKLSNGDPIEEDVAYFPEGGLRNCLQCGHLT